MKLPLLAHLESILNEKVLHSAFSGWKNMGGSRKIKTESGREFFLKTDNPVQKAFYCEANGLQELAKPNVFRIPEIIAVTDNFLLLEYIPHGIHPKNFFEKFGRKLAMLHRFRSENFGFYENNYIGATPQVNIPDKQEAKNWSVFYFQKRLLYQYKLAEKNGYATSRLKNSFTKLESKIGMILQGSEEPPCLLHGDLWGGNYLCDNAGEVVLIDPAVYYGHREADLAMTKLFGGFAPEFYKAYYQAYPLQAGWEYRENIYKLYHILNHLNLFGSGYLHEAERLMDFYR